MYVIDPDNALPADETQPDPATAAATPPEDDIAAAMDAGIADATPEAEPAPEAAKPAEATKEGEPEPAAEPDKEVEAEITGLGLKEKAAARFRELTAEVRELAPIRAQMEAAGIKDVAELPSLVQRATDGADLVRMVTETGAEAEQFGMTLDYLTLATRAKTGDLTAAEKAYELSMGEAKVWAEILGKEVPGVHDPLAAHADLLTDIEAGDLTRKRALEIAAQRQRETVTTAARTTAETRQTQTQAQQQAQEQAITDGRNGLVAFDQDAAKADPHYQAKRPALNAAVTEIRKSFPPSQWVAQTALAYARIPNPAPVPAAKPPIGPVRPTGPRPAMAQASFDDPMAALDAAIAETS